MYFAVNYIETEILRESATFSKRKKFPRGEERKLGFEKEIDDCISNRFVSHHLRELPFRAKVAYNEPRFKYSLQSSTIGTLGRRVFKEIF